MTLRVDTHVAFDGFRIDATFTAAAGRVTALLGPNGAGKTTVLRSIAAAHHNVGVVYQSLALFPSMTARDNVAFGPRSRGMKKDDANQRALALLDRVGVAKRADHKPKSLSGGEAQRVALARALAIDPDVLLLDEPLAALDAATRVEIRRDLRRFLSTFDGPTVLVTHDPTDVLALADDVVVMERGQVTQSGTLLQVTSQPRTRYVADLLGTNLLTGTAHGTRLTTDDGTTVTIADKLDGLAFATIPAAAIALHTRKPSGSPRNQWQTSIEHLDVVGERVRVRLGLPLGLVAEVTPSAVAELGLREGAKVWATVKATEITAYGL